MKTTQPTRAFGILQPWAWAIFHAGMDVMNRNFPIRFRGPVWIYAGVNIRKSDVAHVAETLAKLNISVGPSDDLPLGGIVGRATIVDCVTASESRWFFGHYGFVLQDVEPVPFRPCRGKLGFFVPDMGSAT